MAKLMGIDTVHVLPNPSLGGWDVKREGSTRVILHTETKAEAVKYGRIVSVRCGCGFVVHDEE